MRNCSCSGNCEPQSYGLTRRKFLELTAIGAAGALLTRSAPGAATEQALDKFQLPPEELERWKRELFAPTEPRVYLSSKHTDARMHLGGIGTGNFAIGPDGQFSSWQLFNTLRDGNVPLHFAVKVGEAARLLQTTGGPAVPRVSQIEMVGEYPVARLRFIDPALPVQLELEAFSPFAPLDTRLSSMPLAAFIFRIRNTTAQAQTVSLAAFMQNPVGYDALGGNDSDRNPSFGGNVNEPFQEGDAHGLLFRAAASEKPTLDRPVHIFAGGNLVAPTLPECCNTAFVLGLNAPPQDRPENLMVDLLDHLPGALPQLPEPAQTIVWIEEPEVFFSEPNLRAARDAVRQGSTLVLAGKAMPLLSCFAKGTGGKPLAGAMRPDILFDDFETGYGKWSLSGTAFGKEPASGSLWDQPQVSGFRGKGLVNASYGSTGRAVSREFLIERRFIRFLIGGGSHENTELLLIVNGKIVRSASGKDSEELRVATWEVSELEGKTAHLEIVDEGTGPMGHILVDQIEFLDATVNRGLAELLDELLPVFLTDARRAEGSGQDNPNVVEFENLKLREGALGRSTSSGLRLFLRPLGKGQVVLASGPVLTPELATSIGARQQAYSMLCELVGAKYHPILQHAKASGFGTLALAVLNGESSVMESAEDWTQFWRKFSSDGCLKGFEQARATPPTPAGQTLSGALATQLTVPPGATVEAPFLLSWHYPNKYQPLALPKKEHASPWPFYNNDVGVWLGCHYAEQWADAQAVMKEAVTKAQSWRAKTELFRRTFYDSTLPYWLLDCVTANASTIRYIGVVFRIANGDIYSYEGSNGCCEPTCTHVWGYAQSLARLFPDLEKEMRRIDYKHQQRPDGGVNNRTVVPSPPYPTGEEPFTDGHASCVLKAYREALNSKDESFFREYWPYIARAVEYLIARDAKSHGGQPAGYLEDDEQTNTYDQRLFGVTTFISGYYLAALRAGEEWARRIGDKASAERFHEIFEKGQKNLVELCWNGEYFQQNLLGHEKGKDLVKDHEGQVISGCMSDQLIGQWWAHQLGLGYILPKDKVVSALKSMYKYNFKSDLTDWKWSRNVAGVKDKGLINCTWPKGGRPEVVLRYSDAIWTGVEYQVAAHLIYEGFAEEGFALVKAARDRYDGVSHAPTGGSEASARNPWCEVECGGHYVRSMSSWSLLLALSGWEYDGPAHSVRLAPRHTPENFNGFFTATEGWGVVRQQAVGQGQRSEIQVKSGKLTVKTFNLALLANVRPATVTVTIAGKPMPASLAVSGGRAEIRFASEAVVREDEGLEVFLG